MQDITEDILVQASGGDLKAFEEIYRKASSFVYNVAFRIVANREDAQEVTQEVFITMFDKLKDFRFESSFKTWVYRITANRAINYWKKTSSQKKNTVEYDDAWTSPAVSNDVEKEIERESNEKLIEKLLGAIDPEQRACVVLRNMEGLSYQQIADVLSININTVRSRLNRARIKMLAMRKEVRDERL